MGSSFCKPMTKKIATSSFVANENDNPFEHTFTKKERMLLRETYQVGFLLFSIHFCKLKININFLLLRNIGLAMEINLYFWANKDEY